MQKTIAITVSGKVQGVYYRQSTKEKAIELQLTGEVKNNKDGTASIKASGTKEQLDNLVQWCRHGPKGAVVTGIIFTEIPFQLFPHFSVIRF